MKYKIIPSLLFMMALLSWSCEDDSFPVPEGSEVAADFTVNFTGDDFAPAEVQFTDASVFASGASGSYIWNFGDGNTSTNPNPVHTYQDPGDYEVTLVVTTSNDLDFMKKTVSVRDPNALEVTLLFLDAAGQQIIEIDGGAIDTNGFGTGLAYDDVNEMIYYTDDDNGALVRVARDGTGTEVVSNVFTGPRGVALDVSSQTAYVADRGADAVWAVDLTNGNATVLYDAASDGLGTLPVGIAYYDNYVYITCVDFDAEAVWKGHVDGSGVNRIIDYAAGGFGYGITVDAGNSRIFFDDSDTGQILRANLDGTGIAPVVDTNNRVYGLAVDNTNNKLYWTERNTGNVYMAELDGSNQVTVASGFDDPRGLFFIE